MSRFLFQLIRSLTKAEKIYFKRVAGTHAKSTNKNYLKIYDAVEELDEFDKQVLANKFKDTTIEKYRFSEVNYLQEKLLLSLFNYNLNTTKRNQIQKGILLVEVLTKKGFQKQAIKKLNSVKKEANKYEEFTMLLRLIELEEILLFKEGVIGYKDKLHDLKEQRNSVTNKIQNLNDYHILREEIREIQFSEHLNVNDLTTFQNITSNQMVLNSENCLTIRAKDHWFYIQVLKNYLQRNFHGGLDISNKYVDFMRQNNHLFSDSKMLPVLSNYIYHAALTRNRRCFDEGKKYLNEISSKDPKAHFYGKYILYTRNLEFAYYANDQSLSLENLPLTVDLIKTAHNKFEASQVQYLYMVVVRAAISLKKFKEATILINEWMRHGVLNYRKVQARLFSLIIHYELDYWDLIHSEITLLKKLEKTNMRDSKLIRAFYNFFNKLGKESTNREGLVSALQKDLNELGQEQIHYFEFISFDYYKWSLGLKTSD